MKIVVRTLQVLLAVLALLIAWGTGIEPRLILDEREQVAYIPGLPASWHGREVALLADLQVGMWLDNERMVGKAIRAAVARRPGAILIAGDFVYSPTDEDWSDFVEDFREKEFETPVRENIERVIALLEPLTRSGIPVYAVLGNHDYAMNWESSAKLAWVAERLTHALRAAGITVLRNEAAALRDPASGATPPAGQRAGTETALYIGGIGPEYPDEANVESTLAAIPRDAPRLILMHNPRSYERLPADSAPLALAAHTHGGQVRIPGLPHWSWIEIVKEGDVWTDGWIAHPKRVPGNRLYVNRGIGFSTLPLRINCPPEITYIRLLLESASPAS